MTLKTVGLFALMVKAGLPIPAEAGSVMPIFDQVFADIGDAQAVENDLSTFSAHVTHMMTFLDACGPRTLVMLDELFGSTDPEQGAALGRALIQWMVARGAFVMVTTHLSELKDACAEHNALQAASVGFDVERLEPTYRLRCGLPGSSHAIAVARRLGMPGALLDDATRLLGTASVEREQMLTRLEEAGQLDRTLIVLTSDHGEQLGDHHLVAKRGYFSQSYHVPCIVVDPRPAADATRGTLVEAFTENVDVLPTLMDWLGAPVPRQCNGRSLLPFTRGEVPAGWRTEAHWEYDFRDLAGGLAHERLGIARDDCSLAVLRGERYAYVHFAALPPLLFDQQADPHWLHNVADDPAHQGAALHMARRMLDWRLSQADRTTTTVVDEVDDFLVDQTTEDHLDHVHGLSVGHPHAVDEFRFFADALQHVANLRAAAMHDDGMDADQFHEHHIARETCLQALLGHGVTAVFHDDGFALVALDIGQRRSQHLRNIRRVIQIERHR